MVMLHAALCRNQTVLACDRAWDSELDASPEHPTYYGMLAASFMPKVSNVKVSDVKVSNVKLPLDNFGNQIYTGEASVMRTSDSFYFYFNDWGNCTGVDCCESASGCASCCFDNPPYPIESCQNPYGLNHIVHAYETKDFQTWNYLGVALSLSNRPPGIMFRPCVVYNEKTNMYVMWYEDRSANSSGYTVAVSSTPQGPFVTKFVNVTMPGQGRIGDFNIFVDDDGVAYHIRTGLDIVRLNKDFTGPESFVTSIQPPVPSEAPTLFKRRGIYYITSGSDCCVR